MSLKGAIKILIGKHTLITLIMILLILDIVLISGLIMPWLFQFIIDKHIFEIVVLTALVEMLLLLSTSLWREAPLAIDSEEDAQEKIRSLIKEDKSIKFVKVLSAGLRSRSIFLRELLERNIKLNFEIVACFGAKSPNPDDVDREEYGPTLFKGMTDRLDRDMATRLKIYISLNIPSFRCILLCDSHGPLYGIVGWYTYYDKNTKITGRRNMQIYMDRTTETGVALLHFSDKMFQRYANEKEAIITWPINNDNDNVK